MNIFFLSNSPKQAAHWMVDKHVVKMILETAQLLSTAHRILDGKLEIGLTKTGRKKKNYCLTNMVLEENLYSATHVNHPSAIWARESNVNYSWLYDHFVELNKEYTFRYGKIHKCYALKDYLAKLPLNIPMTNEMTPIRCAMKDEFKISDDPIQNYRNYYKNGKVHLFSWKKRKPPAWINPTVG